MGWLFLLLLLLAVSQWANAAQAKGNPHLAIVVKSARTTKLRPLRSVDNVTLWCQAEDRGVAHKIKSALFVRKKDGHVLSANISDDGKRAFHSLGFAAVDEAGNYTCKITTAAGSVSGNHQVFVRPVAMMEGTDRLDPVVEDPFRYEGLGVTVVIGRDANLTCPVVAFPAATHSWVKDGKPLVMDGKHIRMLADGILHINHCTEEDRGLYECTANNEFTINGHTHVNQLFISRKLRLKSELAWLWPLIVIVVIVTLLVIIIIFCECRKRRTEQKLLESENDD